MTFAEYVQQRTALLNAYLQKISQGPDFPGRLGEAMRYSLLAGGKRFRSLLVMASYEAGGATDMDSILPVVAAVESVHTYSLIHDDLPAMDDDDLRRGQPTNHKKFDEATAILAGDGLLTYAFQLISQSSLSDTVKVRLVEELSSGAGPAGMVHGQMLDMQAEGLESSLDHVREIHRAKTGALIRASVRMGAIMAQIPEKDLQNLTAYAEHLGILFQITDDIMNVISTPEELGKGTGTDAEHGKSTYVTIAGLEESRRLVQEEFQTAISLLRSAAIETERLQQCAEFVANRITK